MWKLAVLVLLVVVLVSSESAPLLHSDSPSVVPGSYIVILSEDLSVLDRDSHILELQDHIANISTDDSAVEHRYNIGSLIGFSARLNKQLLVEQLNHPNVKYIEADQVMSINYKQEPRNPDAIVTQTGATWGISRVSKRDLPYGSTYTYNSIAGSGVDVYVIDTGILVTHVDFGGRATSVFNAISGESASDLNGHGTHCAGTVGGTTYGVAKQVSLKAVKVLDSKGDGTTAGVLAGVNYVTNNKISSRKSVASMSLGGPASTTLDNAVTSSINSGIVYAVAAGNENQNACNVSPARVSTALTVGSTTNTDARSSFSNYGTCVTLFAPGSSITSAWIGSNTATNTISGTSMATPHVAGAAALLWSQNTLSTNTAIRSSLLSIATTNKITGGGTGSPNLLLFTNPTA